MAGREITCPVLVVVDIVIIEVDIVSVVMLIVEARQLWHKIYQTISVLFSSNITNLASELFWIVTAAEKTCLPVISRMAIILQELRLDSKSVGIEM